jgi:hypothetical protein
MSDQDVRSALRDGWISDKQMAEVREKSPRAQRDERQKGLGPPWTRDGRDILYSVQGYREWLASNERSPASQRPLKPHRGNFGHGRDPVQRGKRALGRSAREPENASA